MYHTFSAAAENKFAKDSTESILIQVIFEFSLCYDISCMIILGSYSEVSWW